MRSTGGQGPRNTKTPGLASKPKPWGRELEPSMQNHSPLKLTGACSGCGQEDSLIFEVHPHNGGTAADYKCPACATEVRTAWAAMEQLEWHLNATLPIWLAHWQEQGIDLCEAAVTLELVASRISARWEATAKGQA